MDFNLNPSILSVRSKAELVRRAEAIIRGEGSIDRLAVDRSALRPFITAVSRHYHSNPYHNFHHAVDVTNTMAWLLTRPVFRDNLPDFEGLLLLLAALTHDVDHPGHDNRWEVNTGSALALEYNNAAVLENHSVRVTARLMQLPRLNLFGPFSPAERERAFRTLNDLILATDFAIHQQFLRELDAALASPPYDFGDPEFLGMVCRALIKAADIANSAKPFPQANVWGRRVMKEYWAQGDREKAHNLPVSPLHDKEKTDLNLTQAAFIKNAAIGLFELLSRLEPAVRVCVQTLRANQREYESRAVQAGSSVEQ